MHARTHAHTHVFTCTYTGMWTCTHMTICILIKFYTSKVFSHEVIWFFINFLIMYFSQRNNGTISCKFKMELQKMFSMWMIVSWTCLYFSCMLKHTLCHEIIEKMKQCISTSTLTHFLPWVQYVYQPCDERKNKIVHLIIHTYTLPLWCLKDLNLMIECFVY